MTDTDLEKILNASDAEILADARKQGIDPTEFAARMRSRLKQVREFAATPGSTEAQDQGCCCPVINNRYGNGFQGDSRLFFVDGKCPLHGKETDNE